MIYKVMIAQPFGWAIAITVDLYAFGTFFVLPFRRVYDAALCYFPVPDGPVGIVACYIAEGVGIDPCVR